MGPTGAVGPAPKVTMCSPSQSHLGVYKAGPGLAAACFKAGRSFSGLYTDFFPPWDEAVWRTLSVLGIEQRSGLYEQGSPLA